MSVPDPTKRDRKQYWINMTLAIVAGQVGCLTLVIILAAVLAGLWLDNTYGTKPTFTIGLLLASIPVSVVVMFFVVRTAVAKIKTGAAPGNKAGQEDKNLGDDD
jgi:F0F1-type ATP synthase assembly protein I